MQTEIARQRLLNQTIAGKRFQQPAEVVQWMGAMQAQDYLQALWAIGLRTQSSTVAAVEQAIADRKILRTWPMRGTLHFVASEDARWMLKLSTPRILAGDKRRQQQLELDELVIERAIQLFYKALQGDKRLSRPAMMQLLEDAGISTKGQRGYHLLWYAAQTGVICVGPTENKQQTFALLEDWAPVPRELSHEEALAEFAERYVASHGPATTSDFARWASLTIAEAKFGLEAAKPRLFVEKINGQAYWLANNAPSLQSHDPLASVYLLAGFDEYLLGYKDRSAVLTPEDASLIVPGGNGIFLPLIVVEGLVVGSWGRTLKKNAVNVVLKPFTPLGDAEEQAIEAARSYGDFLGLSPSITVAKTSE